MIHFFRQIRRRLLANGKAGQYFKYAIGEILLVVIGILIALQINNLNTQKNNAKIEQQYLGRLITELEEEISEYEALKDGFSRQNEAVKFLLEFFNEEQLKIQDTAQFWNKFFAGSGPGPWYKEPVIWQQLVQSGELKLIRNQQAVEALFKHYAEVKRRADNFEQYPTQTTNDARKLIATTFAKSDFLLTPGNRRDGNPPTEVLKDVLSDMDQYRVTYVRVGIIARIHTTVMQELIDSARETITILKQDLENDD